MSEKGIGGSLSTHIGGCCKGSDSMFSIKLRQLMFDGFFRPCELESAIVMNSSTRRHWEATAVRRSALFWLVSTKARLHCSASSSLRLLSS